jgi:hypothetical protein
LSVGGVVVTQTTGPSIVPTSPVYDARIATGYAM